MEKKGKDAEKSRRQSTTPYPVAHRGGEPLAGKPSSPGDKRLAIIATVAPGTHREASEWNAALMLTMYPRVMAQPSACPQHQPVWWEKNYDRFSYNPLPHPNRTWWIPT
jgi:hypothetical protein